MSALVSTFEVSVKVRGKKPVGYNSEMSLYYYDEIVRMFHKTARTGKQAMEKCKKYGIPLSVRKVNIEAMHGDFEKLPILNNVYMEGNQYSNAIAMDEMIWEKRNKRRANLYKDKPID